MDTFPDQERYEQAAENVVAFVTAAHRFLQERQIDPAELYEYFGTVYAPGWADVRGDLDAVARLVALNMTSLGCATETGVGDDRATVRAMWPKDIDDPSWPIPPRTVLADACRALWGPVISSLELNLVIEDIDDGLMLRITE